MSSHVFFIFYDLGLGGVQRKIVDIVNYMGRNKNYQDYTPHIIIRRKEEFSFESEITNNKVIIHHFKSYISKKIDKFSFPIYLSHLTFKYNPKVTVSYLHNSSFYAIVSKILLFWRHNRVVIAQDNILSYENKKPYARVTCPNILLKLYYPLADQIIAQSKAVKKDLVENFQIKSKKIKVLPNWVRSFKSSTEENIKKTDLIYCGRFAHQKNPQAMIELVNILQKKIPKLKTTMIGSGELKEEIIKKSNKLKLKINFKPPTHQIEKELKKAKIFILTSKFEGYPITLLEAMSLQTIPVVMEYPSAKDQIDHGKTGFVANDVEEMSLIIEKLLKNKNERNKIAKQARRTTLKNNSEQIIGEFLKIILSRQKLK